MEAFSTHRRIFQLMCIFPLAHKANLWKRMTVFILGFVATLSQILALLTSVVYVSKYATVDLEDSAKTIFQIAAYVNSSYLMCAAFLKRNQMLQVVDKFQRIYDASMFFDTDFQQSVFVVGVLVVASVYFPTISQIVFYTDHGRTSMKFWRDANEMSEKIVVFFLRTSAIFFCNTLVLGIVLVAYCYIVNGYFDANTLFLLYNYA